MTIIVSATAVAWYAATVATISAVATAYNVWRDRVHLVISFSKDMVGFGGNANSNDTYIVVSVANRGRRSVTLGSAVLHNFRQKKMMLLGDSMDRVANHELKEGKSCNYLVKQEGVDVSEIDFFVLWDVTGRKWKKKVKF